MGPIIVNPVQGVKSDGLISVLTPVGLLFPSFCMGYTLKTHPNLAACLNLAWSKLDSYYVRLDKTPAYTASLVLHPQFRLKDSWKGQLSKYYTPIEKSVRALCDKQYSQLSNPVEEEDDNRDFLQKYLDNLVPNKVKDEFNDYAKGSRLLKLDNSVYDWWKT